MPTDVAISDIAVGRFISKGVTGSVYRGMWHGMRCAVKKFNFVEDDPELIAQFKNEVFLLQHLNHENLVRFIAACSSPPDLARHATTPAWLP